ncbi:MAG: transglutaminase domain-containing protein [Saprospiraceae bacterium]
MKLFPLLFFPILIAATLPLSLFGQNFKNVDKLAFNTPPGETTSIKSLAAYLCAEMPDEAHKARALYAWVTLNIAYVDSLDEHEIWATSEYIDRQRPEKVLQNRTAVCQGYANLFCALMAEAGMNCEVVNGLVKKADGSIAPVGHAWATAKINGTWRIFDPTWGVPPPGLARWRVDEQYFMAEPEDFILRHLPDDPMWQLLETPLTEHRFRNSSEGEITDFLKHKDKTEFYYLDTLNRWFSMDSVSRLFASESRILKFNGSNERVIFSLGQRYWGLFFEIQNDLDSLAYAAILRDTINIDTLWFETQLGLMNRYHARARMLFERLETPERIEKAEKFYTPKDVAAIVDKMRGDMHAGVFEYLLHWMPKEGLNGQQIAQLFYQANLVQQHYADCERKMNCAKMPNKCFDIRHNRSLICLQLAQQLVRVAQKLANDDVTDKTLKTIVLNLNEARALYLQVIQDCEHMRRKPPKHKFVQDRAIIAQQGLLTLQAFEIRLEGTALTSELEALVASSNLPERKAKNLAGKMSKLAQSIEEFQDSVEFRKREIGDEFVELTLFNLQLENFALQFNLASLQYRMATNSYEIAFSKNSLPKEREHLRYEANQALQTLKKSIGSLDFLEDAGGLPASYLEQKRVQINKLMKAITAFLDRL